MTESVNGSLQNQIPWLRNITDQQQSSSSLPKQLEPLKVNKVLVKADTPRYIRVVGDPNLPSSTGYKALYYNNVADKKNPVVNCPSTGTVATVTAEKFDTNNGNNSGILMSTDLKLSGYAVNHTGTVPKEYAEHLFNNLSLLLVVNPECEVSYEKCAAVDLSATSGLKNPMKEI